MLEISSKRCCIIGHRSIQINEDDKIKLYNFLKNLIINENVNIFLFGSKGEFNFLCHKIITELKQKYTKILRYVYACKNENFILEEERDKWQKTLSQFYKEEINVLCFDKIFHFENIDKSGKLCYLKRNYKLIDDSDICLFYYNKNYKPEIVHNFNEMIFKKSKNSGTALSYNYANKKKKIIYNFFI